jgi:hypothetical protein
MGEGAIQDLGEIIAERHPQYRLLPNSKEEIRDVWGGRAQAVRLE